MDGYQFIKQITRWNPDHIFVWLGDNDMFFEDGVQTPVIDVARSLKYLAKALCHHSARSQTQIHVMGLLPRVRDLSYNYWAGGVNVCLFKEIPHTRVYLHMV